MIMNVESQLEDADFGDVVGTVGMYQLSAQQFQLECLASNLSVGDSTGLRAYSGSHVAVRFLAKHTSLVEGKSLIEIGCGVGVFGLLGTTPCNPNLLVLTDGEMRAQNIIQRNIELVKSRKVDNKTIYHSQQLKWGDHGDIQNALELCSASSLEYYEVVLGCELMYFNTDLESMINTVLSLTNSNGLYIHAHVFRAPDQEQRFINLLSLYNWSTIEIPCTDYIDKKELNHHVEWRRVRMLISGPIDRITMIAEHHPSWMLFKEEITYADDSDNEEDVDAIKLFN